MRFLIPALFLCLVVPLAADDGQTEAYNQAFVLLKNKGFLDDVKFAELVRLSDQLPREDRERLYSYFELKPL